MDQKTLGPTGGSLLPGRRFPAVSIGPFPTEAVLRMAALAKDYHPAHVLPRVAREAGQRGLLLHSSWISGFAEAAVRSIIPGGRVRELRIHYDNPVFQTDLLTIEIAVVREENEGEMQVLSFEIFNRRKQRVASGTARMHTISQSSE